MTNHANCPHCIAKDHAAGHPPPPEPEPEPELSLGAVVALFLAAVLIVAPSGAAIWAITKWG
ncbi:hypothetical protein [Streptomyces sp. NPDC002851]